MKNAFKKIDWLIIIIIIILASYFSIYFMGIFEKVTTLEICDINDTTTHLKNIGKYTFFIISNVILLQYIKMILIGEQNGSNDTQ